MSVEAIESSDRLTVGNLVFNATFTRVQALALMSELEIALADEDEGIELPSLCQMRMEYFDEEGTFGSNEEVIRWYRGRM